MKTLREEWRNCGKTIAFVPTMGALHDGHMALVTRAKQLADHVIASIFVNPTQFGANEDLGSYPRTEDADCALLKSHGASAVWIPQAGSIYPEGFSTSISVSGVTEGLCGGKRPGHFDGVALIITKLFNIVAPDYACFGEKDYQQLAVIRRLCTDLDFPVTIIGVPTQRDHDGLALSSRNAYLSTEQRAAAVALPNAMKAAIKDIEAGHNIAESLSALKEKLLSSGFAKIDYAELRDAETLQNTDNLERPARLLVAAYMGKTRLIDNMPMG